MMSKHYKEELVEFTNSNDEKLFGIITSPVAEKNGKRIGFVFPNGGLMSREGHNRLHTRTARFLAEKGVYSIRFNPHGIGNSEGDIEQCLLPSLFGKIQSGLFIDDVKTAIDFFRAQKEIDKMILMGVCGGAITVLLTINIEDTIDGMVLGSVPIMLDSPEVDYVARRLTAEKSSRMLEVYIRKMKNYRSIVRFLSFKSNYGDIGAVIKANVSNAIAKINPKKKKPDNDPSSEQERPDKLKENKLFFSSCKKCFERKTKILFIFGENDHFKTEFSESAQVQAMLANKSDPDDYTIKIVKSANHMYTWLEYQKEIMDYTEKWLSDYYF